MGQEGRLLSAGGSVCVEMRAVGRALGERWGQGDTIFSLPWPLSLIWGGEGVRGGGGGETALGLHWPLALMLGREGGEGRGEGV